MKNSNIPFELDNGASFELEGCGAALSLDNVDGNGNILSFNNDCNYSPLTLGKCPRDDDLFQMYQVFTC